VYFDSSRFRGQLAIEQPAILIYFVAPNVKQRFVSTLPGAVIAVGGWIGLSYLLGLYFQDFSAYSKGYGSLGIRKGNNATTK
jgi:hypothetical protein